MQVIKVGGKVLLVRLLPDGRRLLAAVADARHNVTFAVWPVTGGKPVPLPTPELNLKAWQTRAQ